MLISFGRRETERSASRTCTRWSLKSLEIFDKELQRRWYMPELGRFTGVDPIAAQYAHVSTYNYAENEPVGHIDLWGLQKWNAKDGNVINGPYRNHTQAQKSSEAIGNFSKGFGSGLNQRFQLEPARGATVTGIRDSKGGRVKNGSPVGQDVIRVDKPHGSLKQPHINVNEVATGVPDPHTPISSGTLKGLEATGKTLNAINKFAVPLEVVTDAVRLGTAFDADGGQFGDNTIQTAGSVAGGWTGAWAGAAVGAEAGAVFGSLFGPGPGTAVGGFVGGIIGGIGGSVGGSRAGEKAASIITEKKK